MQSRKFLTAMSALALLGSALTVAPAALAAGSGTTRLISSAGTSSPRTGGFVPSGDGLGSPEFPSQLDSAAGPGAYNGIIDRSLSTDDQHASNDHGNGSQPTGGERGRSGPALLGSFEGLNLFQQRYARGGNQFTLEPPDQALCVGNGYVVEATNDVLNVYNSSGVSQLPANTVGGAVDLNSFYGYPPAINRTTGVSGPFITDPTCLFDAQTQRFYLVVLTLDTTPAGAFTLTNHLDVAVSNSSDPTGAWTIYQVNATNDGTNPDVANACPCLGDYPHIGADANGFYITTNAYPWAGNGFDGAQIYAFSKRQLASGAASVNVTHIDTFGAVNLPSVETLSQPGFTVWPAQSPGKSSFDLRAGGTEYFLSSNAADEATHPITGGNGSHQSDRLIVWALSNTSSLDTATPTVSLTNKVLPVNQYAVPPKADQPGSGSAPDTNDPLGHGINDTTTPTVAGVGCWRLLFGVEPSHTEVVSKLDANDTRMQQVMYADEKLWGSLDTAVSFSANPADNRAGIAWYVVKPEVSDGSIDAEVDNQGTYGIAGLNLTYPAIGVTASGRGVVAMTLVGPNDYPSAAYASIDSERGVGAVVVGGRGGRPRRRIHELQVLRGRPAPDPLGRLWRRCRRWQLGLDCQRVHREQLHLYPMGRASVHGWRAGTVQVPRRKQSARRTRQLVDPDHPAQALRVAVAGWFAQPAAIAEPRPRPAWLVGAFPRWLMVRPRRLEFGVPSEVAQAPPIVAIASERGADFGGPGPAQTGRWQHGGMAHSSLAARKDRAVDHDQRIQVGAQRVPWTTWRQGHARAAWGAPNAGNSRYRHLCDTTARRTGPNPCDAVGLGGRSGDGIRDGGDIRGGRQRTHDLRGRVRRAGPSSDNGRY